ncbi:hypothetical protein [uncultured Phenylobacterium sp.]|uniref:hypothetical protein n=1 Tax=uncultured Phenylobacterium sp. TaxID=349273 RepID=UPI0025FFAD48|nr:hypothetical protein [uncultured Phenylobacterium sp.]
MSNDAPGLAEADTRIGLFNDPLADWTNDDILLTKPARAMLGQRHLQGLRVLDWPELRQLFGKYEAPANKHGRRDRGLGLASVAMAVLGLMLAAFAPLALGVERWVGLTAAVLTLSGAALTAFHWLDHQSKARWLGNRFWTERVRGLYFQAIVNNLDLVARAMTDNVALGEWKVVRARALEALPKPDDVAHQIGKLAGTVEETDVWVLPEWSHSQPPPPPSEGLDILLPLLRSQRFDVQLAYVDRKLSDSLRAPGRRSQLVSRGSEILPAMAVLAAAAAGILMATGVTLPNPWVRLALATAASATAVALALRVINDSLLLSDDASRYAWYSAAVMRARSRFDAGDLGEKLAALRDMETVAYRDLREFVAAHWRARYVP